MWIKTADISASIFASLYSACLFFAISYHLLSLHYIADIFRHIL
uniref:Uncharacterized protein n=1 Tax=Siphoviridae sp. ctF7F8 TaxID=2826211 RepID=A0A8S5MK14_9CAUD|nr:MAG TPA: hypothetical protein [Siphoviridae sp. ctF7F8]